jgi:prepilin-type processing-associated H-X9-DG protein
MNPVLYEFSEDMPGMYHNRSAGFAFADGGRKSVFVKGSPSS